MRCSIANSSSNEHGGESRSTVQGNILFRTSLGRSNSNASEISRPCASNLREGSGTEEHPKCGQEEISHPARADLCSISGSTEKKDQIRCKASTLSVHRQNKHSSQLRIALVYSVCSTQRSGRISHPALQC